VEGPDETERPKCVSKNATRSRSLDVGGRVTVEAARVEVLRLIRMSAAVACKCPRNRKGGRNALDKAFLAVLVSINHPYVPGERGPCRMPVEENDRGTNPSRCNPKPDAKPHVTSPGTESSSGEIRWATHRQTQPRESPLVISNHTDHRQPHRICTCTTGDHKHWIGPRATEMHRHQVG
jgi:hypothetical protein